MAGLSVSINGKEITSVASEGLQLIVLSLHGDLFSEELAILHLTGIKQTQEDGHTHFTWINVRELTEHDMVEVLFDQDIESSHPGKTVEELFPESDDPELPMPSMEEVAEWRATQTRRRLKHEIELRSADGTFRSITADDPDYGFSFSVKWIWVRPDEASVRLTTTLPSETLDGKPGAPHTEFRLQHGESVGIRVR